MRACFAFLGIFICFSVQVCGATYSGGSGTAEDPYKIGSVADWQTFMIAYEDSDENFILTNDLDLAEVAVTPIDFTGTLDGNNHTIKHINIMNGSGLFGYLDTQQEVIDGRLAPVKGTGRICNLRTEDVNVTGEGTVGGLVGVMFGGEISNCFLSGSVLGYANDPGDWWYFSGTGGLIGVALGGNVEKCFFGGAVSLSDNDPYSESGIGGLIGIAADVNINNCHVNGDISGGSNVGGLVGQMGLFPGYTHGNVNIKNSYVTGTVKGNFYIGGLIGSAEGCNIEDCNAIGTVTGNTYVGGLIGMSSAVISKSFFQGNVFGSRYFGGLVGYVSTGDYGQEIPRIDECCSRGTVSGGEFGGGLIGYFGRDCGTDKTTFYNCYSQASVSGTRMIGGFIGASQGECLIYCCYSSGNVNGDILSGGFAGGPEFWQRGSIKNCYWDIESSGQDTSVLGEGKTTEEMKSAATFFSWGCDNDWTIDDGNDYPRLAWEKQSGKVISSANYGGGSGTAEDPFLIYTPEQLNTIDLIPCHLGMHFKLMADLDLRQYHGTDFNIIGNQSFPFTGTFNGNGKVIRNFTYEANEWGYTGLFGYVSGNGSEIRNLGLVDVNVSQLGYCTGSLAGEVVEAVIDKCYVSGGIVRGRDDTGGLIGSNSDSLIIDSFAKCTVQGFSTMGGLIGGNWGNVTRCYAKCDIAGPYVAGGLIGANSGHVSQSYSFGSVAGQESIGGFFGRTDYASVDNCYTQTCVLGTTGETGVGGFTGWSAGTRFDKCYAANTITGQINVAGFIGYDWRDSYTRSVLTNCVWDITLNPDLRTIGNITNQPDGCNPKSTEQLESSETFTQAGWDFVGETANGTEDIWYIRPGEYPRLRWQNHAPIANAGADRIFYVFDETENAAVILSASGSTDADGDVLRYEWNWELGDVVGESNQVTLTMELPIGQYTFGLIVNDRLVDSEADYVNVTVGGPLRATVRITPNTINSKSKQKEINAVISLPANIKASDVDQDFGLVIYPGELKSQRQIIKPGASEISLSFDKDAVCDAAGNGEAELKVAGKLKSGQWFYGADRVKIVH